jgi:hypothetical protein
MSCQESKANNDLWAVRNGLPDRAANAAIASGRRGYGRRSRHRALVDNAPADRRSSRSAPAAAWTGRRPLPRLSRSGASASGPPERDSHQPGTRHGWNVPDLVRRIAAANSIFRCFVFGTSPLWLFERAGAGMCFYITKERFPVLARCDVA